MSPGSVLYIFVPFTPRPPVDPVNALNYLLLVLDPKPPQRAKFGGLQARHTVDVQGSDLEVERSCGFGIHTAVAHEKGFCGAEISVEVIYEIPSLCSLMISGFL